MKGRKMSLILEEEPLNREGLVEVFDYGDQS
jgi:hypothetical protein